jgi:hypothetical protein
VDVRPRWRCPACGSSTDRYGGRHACVDGIMAGHDPDAWGPVNPVDSTPPILRDPRIPPDVLYVGAIARGTFYVAPLGTDPDDPSWAPLGECDPSSFRVGVDPSRAGDGGIRIVAEERLALEVRRPPDLEFRFAPSRRLLRLLLGRSPTQRWNDRCPSWLTVGVADGRRAIGEFPGNGRLIRLWRVRRG